MTQIFIKMTTFGKQVISIEHSSAMLSIYIIFKLALIVYILDEIISKEDVLRNKHIDTFDVVSYITTYSPDGGNRFFE